MRGMSPADPQVAAPPTEAFRFKASSAKLEKPDASGRRKFKALFYSGELIPNHWYWGNLVFDVSTTQANESTGVLLEHDPKAIVGSGKCTFDKNSMSIEGLLSAKTDAAKHVAEQADEEFPWQMSHFIEPGEIDQIKPGAKVSVNGREFTGPVTIFRQNRIRHVTFCADGADMNTSATVFNRHGAPSMTQAAAPTAPTNPPTATVEQQLADMTAKFNTEKARADAAVAEATTFRKARITEVFQARGEESDRREDRALPLDVG
jgi:hypothetical protein